METYNLIVSVVFPILVGVLGGKYLFSPPKNFMAMIAYKSMRSAASKDTWEFAHKFLGWWCLVTGSVMTVATFVVGSIFSEQMWWIAILSILATLSLLAVGILLVEKLISKKFDSSGKRKEKNKFKK